MGVSKMAARVGLEPTTLPLTGERSTIELPSIVNVRLSQFCVQN